MNNQRQEHRRTWRLRKISHQPKYTQMSDSLHLTGRFFGAPSYQELARIEKNGDYLPLLFVGDAFRSVASNPLAQSGTGTALLKTIDLALTSLP
jgi:hypothetical protein